MTAAPPRPRFVVRGWHVLAAFVVFFGVDIAVNAYFMAAAYGTYPGETSVTPYEDGIAYNAALQQRRAQAALGWRLAADLDSSGRLRVEAWDRAGAPLPGLGVAVHLERPATEAGQRDVILREAAPGTYLGETPPARGAWDLSVTVRDAAGHMAKADRRLAVS
jgi:nitrogen fixation protein FixH